MVASLSVIIPVYNMEKYLRKCLDSIINQTLTDIEIICVNDGSTDNSYSILEEYSKKDCRITLINKKNGGLSSARNEGLKYVTSDFVTFVDSDDWIDLETYGYLKRFLGLTDIIVFGVTPEGNISKEQRMGITHYYKLPDVNVSILTDSKKQSTNVVAWNKIYRTDIIKNNSIQFPTGLLYEDLLFYWVYISYCKTCFYCSKQFYHHLERSDSIMGTTNNKNNKAAEHVNVALSLFDYYYNHSLYDKNKDNFEILYNYCFWYSFHNSNLLGKIKTIMMTILKTKNIELNSDHTISVLSKRDIVGFITIIINHIKNKL